MPLFEGVNGRQGKVRLGRAMLILAPFLIKLTSSVQRPVQMAWPGHLCGTWRVKDTKQCLLLGSSGLVGFGAGLPYCVVLAIARP